MLKALAAVAVAWCTVGCLHSSSSRDEGWTVAEAESIGVIHARNPQYMLLDVRFVGGPGIP